MSNTQPATLGLTVPVYFLDGGPHVAAAQHYWQGLLAAHRVEMEATFGTLLGPPVAGDDSSWIAELTTPSVLIIPAIGGGRIKKDWGAWWVFREHVAAFRRRGGVVLVLRSAFHLPAEEQRARGRAWEGFENSGEGEAISGRVKFIDENKVEIDAFDAHALKLHGEWRCEQNPHVTDIAHVSGATGTLPLAWRWSREPYEEPGAMVFTTCWGWTRYEIGLQKKAKSQQWLDVEFNRKAVETVFVGLRKLNRVIVEREVERAVAGLHVRMERLEKLSGDTVRLTHRTGREKDYHRLLVNDPELCIDLIGWRDLVDDDDGKYNDGGVSKRFRATFSGEVSVFNEPGHDKGDGRKGRLDIVFCSDPGVDDQGVAYLDEPDRGACAWVELEAGKLHPHQIEAFVTGEGKKLRTGDYVVAVDRSHDADVNVLAARKLVEALGVTFIHVQVPQAFAKLEEAYAPDLHSLSRKRYALDVIRGLLG